MISIKYKNGENQIYNTAGHQLKGSMAEGLVGLNPKELLEASLGLCISITMTRILDRDGIPYDDSGVDIEVVANKTEGIENRFTSFSVSVKFPELDPKYRKKLKIMVERGCTISNTLRNGAAIEITERN